MNQVVDRISTYPKRITFTNETTGTTSTGIWAYADEPTQVGTPINSVLFNSIDYDLPKFSSNVTLSGSTYIATVSTDFSGYFDGLRITIIPVSASVTDQKLSINELSAIPILDKYKQPIGPDYMMAGIPYEVIYYSGLDGNSSNFILLGEGGGDQSFRTNLSLDLNYTSTGVTRTADVNARSVGFIYANCNQWDRKYNMEGTIISSDTVSPVYKRSNDYGTVNRSSNSPYSFSVYNPSGTLISTITTDLTGWADHALVRDMVIVIYKRTTAIATIRGYNFSGTLLQTKEYKVSSSATAEPIYQKNYNKDLMLIGSDSYVNLYLPYTNEAYVSGTASGDSTAPSMQNFAQNVFLGFANLT